MLADPLVALLPPPLARHAAAGRLSAGVLGRPAGSVIFAALDGVDRLAARLLAGGAAGEDALRRTLGPLYATLVAATEEHGGQAVGLSAGALVVVLEPEAPRRDDRPADDVQRAFACALALQDRVIRFLTLETPTPVPELALRAGVGAGECVHLCAGGPAAPRYALAGSALDEALAAHQVAHTGEVVAGAEALGLALGMASLGLRAHFGLVAGAPTLDVNYRYAPEPLPFVEAARLEACLPARLRGPGAAALVAGGALQAAAVAARWPSRPERLAAPAELLDYLASADALAAEHGGWLSELQLGGEHGRLVAVFAAEDEAAGAALPHAQAYADALRAAAGQHAWPGGLQLGVAAGPVFAGAFGSERRRGYLAAGSPIAEAVTQMNADVPLRA